MSNSIATVPRPSLSPWLVLLLPLLGIILYLNVLDNPLHGFDIILTTANPQVNAGNNGGDTTGVWFAPTPSGALVSAQYRPMLTLLLRAEYKLWGESPSSFHLINLILFIAAVVLMLLLTAELIPHRGGRALACLMLVTHPLVTESVQSVGGQSVLLVLVCLLVAGRWLVRFRQGRHEVWTTGLVLGACIFIAACSHEIGLLVPLMLLALAFVPVALPPTPRALPRGGRRLIKKRTTLPAEDAPGSSHHLLTISRLCLPAVAALIGYLFLRHLALGQWIPLNAINEARQWKQALPFSSGGSTIATYLWRIVFPWRPTLIYAPDYDPMLFLPAFIGWIVAACLMLVTVCLWKRNRTWALAMTWLLLPFVALAHLLPLTTALSETAALMAIPGWALVIGCIASISMSPHWAPGRTRVRDALMLGIVGLACLFMCWQTLARSRQWKSSEQLWQAEAALHPGNPRPLTELMDVYRRSNQLARAQELIPTTRKMAHGADVDAIIRRHASLLAALNQTNQLGSLLDDEIITTRTATAGHFEQLADLAEQNKMRQRAEALWKRELVINPNDVNALGSLADYALKHKNYNTALLYGQRAAHFSPQDLRAGTLAHYGQILAESGHVDSAIAQFKSALQIDPTLYLPYQYRIRIAAGKNQWQNAFNLTNEAFTRARVNSYAELAKFYVLILEAMHRDSEALEKIMILVNKFSQDIDLRIFAAQYLLDRRQWSRAEQTLMPLTGLADKRRAAILTALAVIQYERDKNRSAAEQLLKKALEVDPEYQDARRLLSDLNQAGSRTNPIPPKPATIDSLSTKGASLLTTGSTTLAPFTSNNTSVLAITSPTLSQSANDNIASTNPLTGTPPEAAPLSNQGTQ